MLHKSISTLRTLILLSLFLGIFGTVKAQGGYDPTVQTPALLYDEARTVYLGNLARRNNGVPPLRWNRQLTHAARWFSWDSVENRLTEYCGHEDTLGGGFWNRAATWSYLGWAGAENAFCGYVTPQDAINGWMNSSGHRANLLNADFRELGLGYYRRLSDGRGYITQDFGGDYVYAPAIIENEAVSTTNPNVNLYIYNRDTTGGFISHGAAVQMMVSNNPYFQGSAWEPYNPNKAWSLTGGTGWRNVYVKTRDRFNRTMTVFDTIYLGATVPVNELGSSQMSTRQSQVTLYNLNGGALPQVQFSPGWMADDTTGSFNLLWGNGERVNDATAWGGTAFRLRSGNGESFAWVDDWKFPIKDTPLVAYFRLKVSDNTSPGDVGRISVNGGGIEYGPVFLKGTDFNAPNQYQEFAIPFTYNTDPSNVFLTFQFWRSGDADVYVDAVSIFSEPQPITSPLSWSVPGNNYRGQGIWVRYTNGNQFSALSEAATTPPIAAIIHVVAAGANMGRYELPLKTSVRPSYAGLDNGPMRVIGKNDIPIVTSERVAYSPNGGTTWTSYSELMGLPANLVHTSYTFPHYNNVDLNSQLRFANVGTATTTVTIIIGGQNKGSFNLAPNASRRVSYAGLSAGPVVIRSNGQPIIASLRVAYTPDTGATWTSFSEMMGLPSNKLTNSYMFPWYNNATLDSQIRFGNVGTSSTMVTVKIGGQVKGTYPLAPNQSQRVSYAGLDSGPVVISSNGQPIIASIRVAYTPDGGATWTNFSEMMGLPTNALSTNYYFPAYDSVHHNSQLRFGNVGTATTNVKVFINGVLKGTYPAAPNASQRISYSGLDSGPVVIQSSGGVPIIASLRVAYTPDAGVTWTSFAEMMGLPQSQLTTSYYFPWYNNLDLDTQLRIGVP